tara:strand:- start:268 stop:396 length:129 start_codon:yes stop_codon:yes gene_type:complete
LKEKFLSSLSSPKLNIIYIEGSKKKMWREGEKPSTPMLRAIA